MAKKKEEKTNVMRILDQRKIPYTARFYEDSQGPEGTREYGVHVAEALGQDPARGFKTLVARGASKGIYVFEVPAPENLDLKKAARAYDRPHRSRRTSSGSSPSSRQEIQVRLSE